MRGKKVTLAQQEERSLCKSSDEIMKKGTSSEKCENWTASGEFKTASVTVILQRKKLTVQKITNYMLPTGARNRLLRNLRACNKLFDADETITNAFSQNYEQTFVNVG
jgi:hypothetical protein